MMWNGRVRTRDGKRWRERVCVCVCVCVCVFWCERNWCSRACRLQTTAERLANQPQSYNGSARETELHRFPPRGTAMHTCISRESNPVTSMATMYFTSRPLLQAVTIVVGVCVCVCCIVLAVVCRGLGLGVGLPVFLFVCRSFVCLCVWLLVLCNRSLNQCVCRHAHCFSYCWIAELSVS